MPLWTGFCNIHCKFEYLKKFATILFASLILLSGGVLQTVLHVCPQQGVMLDKDDCGMHEKQTLKECCRVNNVHAKHVEKSDEHCCTDTYLFMVSAKFGNIDLKNIQIPVSPISNIFNTEFHSRFSNINLPIIAYQHPPPETTELRRSRQCIWII